VYTEPPLGFATEQKLLLQPFSCSVNVFSLPDLFAGKVHALLYRRWQNRVKGRDWFDFEWYVRQGHAMRLAHLNARAIQSGHAASGFATGSDFKLALMERIHLTSFESAKIDMLPFIQNSQQLSIWSTTYFADLVKAMKVLE
jgi:Nucleotidyl transferase AbiEii toxin, Type IV TA system